MKKLSVLIALPLIVSLSGTAMASDKSGAYVGMGLGYGQVEGDFKGMDLSFKDQSPRLNLQAGYRFNDFIAIEGGYYNMGDHKYKTSDSVGDIELGLKSQAFAIAAVGFIPLNDDFEIYGKLGAASINHHMSSKTSWGEGSNDENDKSAFLAAGINYSLNDNLALYGETMLMNTEVSDGFKVQDRSMNMGIRFSF